MNKLYEDKLKRLNDDQYLLDALKAIFNERVEKERPVIFNGERDETIGQKYRAYDTAKDILYKTILDIEAYKNYTNNGQEINKAI